MADRHSESVELRVSKELYALYSMQERANRFLWTSEAAYAYALKHLDELDGQQDAETALMVQSRAWDRATSGRRHFEGSLESLRLALRDNSEQIYGTVLLQYYAAFERFLLRRRGAYRRRLETAEAWSPVIGGCAHLRKEVGFPVPIGQILLGDLSRLLRNIVAHGDHVPLSSEDARVLGWRRRAEAALRGSGWEGDHAAELRYASAQVFGRVEHLSAKHRMPALYFFMLFSFTNLSGLALAVEEALFDPALDEARVVRRQVRHVRRADLIVRDGEA